MVYYYDENISYLRRFFNSGNSRFSDFKINMAYRARATLAWAYNNNHNHSNHIRSKIMKDIEQHRANTITMIEALLLLERREGDNILVISPKGITPEGWRVANDMAMGLRAITVSKSKKENAESVACATSMVIGLQEDMKILEKLFPKGPRHLHNIMNELSKKFKGIGFGEILKITAKLVYMLETKQY